ncbi:GGDEF domain-containing protein [Deinococcus misasensis]|uniref:GGDEF domain-containing protein n=1 Tax=Deinococcus misasensis TaxID=392413 RepID=UPI00068BE876|nr:sensor domain-containing diguanylate cyclase [Deinococcus misasensis]
MSGTEHSTAPSPRDIAQQMLLVLREVTGASFVRLNHPWWGNLSVGLFAGEDLPTIDIYTPDGLGQVVLQGTHLSQVQRDVQQAHSYARTILNLSRLLSSEIQLHDLLRQSLEVLQETLSMDFVFLLQMDRENHHLQEAWFDLMTPETQQTLIQQLTQNDSLAWEALRSGQARHQSEVQVAAQPLEVMVLPLNLEHGEGRVLVVGRQHGRPWRPDERRLLESVALGVRMLHKQGTYVQHLRDAALVDALTGLGNRRAFEGALEQALQEARAQGLSLGVMVLDLDGLKKVNDELGHEQGDVLLKTFGEALKQHLRQTDPAYRLGGDEFAVILKKLQPGQLSILETRLNAIRDTVRHKGFQAADASAGVAFLGRDGETPGELCRVADERMYAQKSIHKQNQSSRASSLIGSFSPRVAWQSLRSTLELLSHDQEASPRFWRTLLEAAVQTLPSVEAGSMDVWRDGFYVVAAQVGYSDDLLGLHLNEEGQLNWYGQGRENYLQGKPRLLYGADIMRHSSATLEDNQYAVFTDAGSLSQVKSTLLLPIVVDGHPIAHMNLDNHTVEKAFSAEAMDMALDFSAQVTALLLAQQRREIIAEREKHMQLLQEFCQSLPALAHEARLQALQQLAMELLGTSQVCLGEHDAGLFSVPVGRHHLNVTPQKGNALSRSGKEHLQLAVALVHVQWVR